jgi:hypothetical protein
MATPTTNPKDLAEFLKTFSQLVIPQRTAQAETSFVSAAPGALDLSNLIAGMGVAKATDPQTDLVSNILYRARLAFSPNLAEERTSGLYNATTKNLLANEAMARAVGESASAVLQSQQAGLKEAGQQAQAQLATSKTAGGSKAAVNKPGLGDTLSSALVAGLGVQGAKKVWEKISGAVAKKSDLPEQLAGPTGAVEDVAAGAGTSLSSFPSATQADIAASGTGIDVASSVAGGTTSLAPAATTLGANAATAGALGAAFDEAGNLIGASAPFGSGGVGGAIGSFGPAEGAAASVGATELASAVGGSAGIGEVLASIASVFSFI